VTAHVQRVVDESARRQSGDDRGGSLRWSSHVSRPPSARVSNVEGGGGLWSASLRSAASFARSGGPTGWEPVSQRVSPWRGHPLSGRRWTEGAHRVR
jgi:hypothetical protein